MHLKALVVADHESEYIWDYFDARAFQGVDVIISCGDLKASYLSFLVTMIPAPLLFVRGNHDESYADAPPEGCIDLEEKPITIKGVRFVGFGGCMSGRHAENHYTERAMSHRVSLRTPRLTLKGGFDVLVTHAPALGLGDGDDSFHRGFACYKALLDRFQPAYHLHGHQHLCYGANAKRILTYNHTTIVNGSDYCILDMEIPNEREQSVGKATLRTNGSLSHFIGKGGVGKHERGE